MAQSSVFLIGLYFLKKFLLFFEKSFFISKSFIPLCKQNDKKMLTLKLKKQCAGSYANKAGGIEITLRNNYLLIGNGDNVWKLWIEKNDQTILHETFNTKKAAMIFGANWIINNLNK